MTYGAKNQWTFCEKDQPTRKDLIHLAQIINYHKRRVWSLLSEPYANGFDDDQAEEKIEEHLGQIEDFCDEYSWMLATLGLTGRVA